MTENIAEAERARRSLLNTRLFALHPVTRELATAAAELAVTHRLRGCDAVYVALARQFDDVLATFDEEQLPRSAAAIRVERPA